MQIAASAPPAETFHEWPKRVKYLRYQVEALHLMRPPLMDGTAETLGTLAAGLGDEHDHAELAEIVGGAPWLLPDPVGRRHLLAHIARRRSEMQREAPALGRRLYHETPDAFVDRHRAYWDARMPA